jgi:hypothetical protein
MLEKEAELLRHLCVQNSGGRLHPVSVCRGGGGGDNFGRPLSESTLSCLPSPVFETTVRHDKRCQSSLRD